MKYRKLNFQTESHPELHEGMQEMVKLFAEVPQFNALIDKATKSGEISVEFVNANYLSDKGDWVSRNRQIFISLKSEPIDMLGALIYQLHNASNPFLQHNNQAVLPEKFKNADEYAMAFAKAEYTYAFEPATKFFITTSSNPKIIKALNEQGIEITQEMVKKASSKAIPTLKQFVEMEADSLNFRRRLYQSRMEELAAAQKQSVEEEIEPQTASKTSQPNLQMEKLQTMKLEQARLREEKLEQAKLLKEKTAAERAEKAKLLKEKAEQAKLEQAKLREEKLEKARLQKEKLQHAKLERSALLKEKQAALRANQSTVRKDPEAAQQDVVEELVQKSDTLAAALAPQASEAPVLSAPVLPGLQANRLAAKERIQNLRQAGTGHLKEKILATKVAQLRK